jgi:SHS2 domain-containing protein
VFMERYKLIEHTADLGIEAYGKTPEELFCNSAFAMFDLIADLGKINLKEKVEFELTAENQSELLINWLRRLHSYYAVYERLFGRFQITALKEKELRGFAEGEKFDLKRHVLKREIKAVTYHQMGIEKNKNIYTTQIIFDV